jgi:hypothetical protein
MCRVHREDYEPNQFNPGKGSRSRFAPLIDPRDPSRSPIPTLYLARTVSGALSESVFHDVPVRGPDKRILVSRLAGQVLSMVRPRRGLDVALLAGPGLMRLDLERTDLIDTDPSVYPDTAEWALAIHDCPSAPEGLMWMARHDERSTAVVLFGDRVPADDLELVLPPIPLWEGPGLEFVEVYAEAADVAVVR